MLFCRPSSEAPLFEGTATATGVGLASLTSRHRSRGLGSDNDEPCELFLSEGGWLAACPSGTREGGSGAFQRFSHFVAGTGAPRLCQGASAQATRRRLSDTTRNGRAGGLQEVREGRGRRPAGPAQALLVAAHFWAMRQVSTVKRGGADGAVPEVGGLRWLFRFLARDAWLVEDGADSMKRDETRRSRRLRSGNVHRARCPRRG